MSMTAKLRKFIKSPGEFFRDALLNKYPIKISNRMHEEPIKFNILSGELLPHENDFNTKLYDKGIIYKNIPVKFPIDIVFTWVDFNSNNFQTEYKKYLDQASSRKEVYDKARFEAMDELKYSLRSIEKYAPWINKIFIVTNGQVPAWLDVNHPKIKMINHCDILEDKYLPTFNSHVIESALHRIPELSDHYIYLNDDVILTRPVEPDYFFSGSGLAFSFVSQQKLKDKPIDEKNDTPTEWAAKNSRDAILQKFKYSPDILFAHTFMPQLKSVAEECETLWPKLYENCRKNKFRATSDILTTGFLVPHVGQINGKNLFTRTPLFYFNVRKKDAKNYYAALLEKKNIKTMPYSICPNDHKSIDEIYSVNYKKEFKKFMNIKFKNKSSYEK